MAKVTFVKSAQKPIYQFGKRVEYVSQKGKREGQTLTNTDRSQPRDENDYIFINEGESYYWWQFKNGGKNISKTSPKRSQLTQSSFLSQIYSIEENISTFHSTDPDDCINSLEQWIEELNEMKEQCEESLSNMPESLQSSPTGELLQERIDGLDEIIQEMESIDTDLDNSDIAEEEELERYNEEWCEKFIEELGSVCFPF